jgi:hypothetical protein
MNLEESCYKRGERTRRRAKEYALVGINVKSLLTIKGLFFMELKPLFYGSFD